MKNLLVIMILAAGLIGSAYQYLQLRTSKNVLEQLRAQIQATTLEEDEYSNALDALPVSSYTTNSDMIADLVNSSVVELMQITAQKRDEFGNYSNVVSVTTTDEVAFFTNTIDRIMVLVKYADFNQAYEYITSVKVPYTTVDFDVDNNTLSIGVTPITIGTSELDSEITQTPKTDTDQAGSEASAEEEPETSSEFDIQYLGGDENE